MSANVIRALCTHLYYRRGPCSGQHHQRGFEMTPSLAVFTNNQIVDELYRRISLGNIQLEFVQAGEGYAQVRIVTGLNKNRYAFETIAHQSVLVR